MSDMRPPAPNEPGSERRRSHRVNIAMPILVRGKTSQPFQEETHTISVNAHGCVFRLATQVKRLQQIAIVNSKTAEELPCKVTFLGQKESGKTEVGVEFCEPSPLFWRIAFPPEDWDPSERKRPGGSRPSSNPNGR
jgi:hypothetical protein